MTTLKPLDAGQAPATPPTRLIAWRGEPGTTPASPSARRFAQRSFPSDEVRQQQLATAFALLERSDSGRDLARELLERGVVVRVASFTGHAAGGIGDNEIKVHEKLLERPHMLAATIAHEGLHLKQLEDGSLLAALGGAVVMGVLQLGTAVPTLGMMDLTARFHRPGTGLKMGLVQGLFTGTGPFAERPAYELEDRVMQEIAGKYVPVVANEDGSRRNRLASSAQITSTYIANHSWANDDSAIGRSNLFSAGVPAALTAAWLGARKLSPAGSRRARFAAVSAAITGALTVLNAARLLRQGTTWPGPDVSAFGSRPLAKPRQSQMT